jgi:two-component system response regulator FixJ
MSLAYRCPVTVAEQALAEQCAKGLIIIIDDDDQILQALAALVMLEGFACETYPSGLAYLQTFSDNIARFAGPSCLLCDVKMPGLDGLELQQRLLQQVDTPLLLMSGASGALEAASAFRAGALDFLIKPIDADDLLIAITKALAISTERRAQRLRAVDLASRIASLTSRERQVARDVAHGQTNPAIADKLGIALRTVKLHRQNAMEKLGINTTAELVRLADEGGL